MSGSSYVFAVYLSVVVAPPAQFTCVYNAGLSVGNAALPKQLLESYTWRACDATTRQLTSLSFFAYGFNVLQLPASLGNITALTTLNFAANSLTGSIPDSFGRLTNLRRLSLQNGRPNNQAGSVSPMDYLGANALTGSIPATLGSLTALTALSLAVNQLSGSIPSSFGALTALTLLDLGSNLLSGSIPPTLGSLFQTSGIGTLQLSFNELTGPVTFIGSSKAGAAGFGLGFRLRVPSRTDAPGRAHDSCYRLEQQCAFWRRSLDCAR